MDGRQVPRTRRVPRAEAFVLRRFCVDGAARCRIRGAAVLGRAASWSGWRPALLGSGPRPCRHRRARAGRREARFEVGATGPADRGSPTWRAVGALGRRGRPATPPPRSRRYARSCERGGGRDRGVRTCAEDAGRPPHSVRHRARVGRGTAGCQRVWRWPPVAELCPRLRAGRDSAPAVVSSDGGDHRLHGLGGCLPQSLACVPGQAGGLFRRGCCETPVARVDGVPCLLCERLGEQPQPALLLVGRRRPP